jgi:RNA polymerase sigma factor (sigma-70 family)
MDSSDLSTRLTNIKTHWTVLFQAHQPSGDKGTAARQQLLLRYYGAVYRYLLGTVRDLAVAEDLTQEFAMRFLRGDFHRADPKKGRFRDFLKTALRHLAHNYWSKKDKAPAPLPPAASEELAGHPEDPAAPDQAFLDQWREELLTRTWEALEELQRRTGQPFHTILRWKTEQPELRSVQLGQRLGDLLGKSYSEIAVRKLMQRARQNFADLLLEEVSRSLQTTEPEPLEQELIELQLLEYCRPALDRRDRRGEGER